MSCDCERCKKLDTEIAKIDSEKNSVVTNIILHRFTVSATGDPSLVVALQLDARQAAELLDWYESRQNELKTAKWAGWNAADMALRTLCVQIDAYGKQAFGRVPGLFDVSLPESI